MAVETKSKLKEQIIKKIQKLIRSYIDSYDGLRVCADEIEDERVADLFRDLAGERSDFARQ